MTDDLKLGMRLDLDIKDAQRQLDLLGKDLRGGISVLGSGGPPTSISQSANPKDSVRGMIDALDRIEKTLVAGFQAATGIPGLGSSGGGAGPAQGAGGGGGAGFGGGGAGAGGGKKGFFSGFGSAWTSVGGSSLVNGFAQTGEMMAGPIRDAINSGGYSGDIQKLISSGVNSWAGQALLGPLGPGAKIFDKYVGDEYNKKEAFRDKQYDMWKTGGNRVAADYTDAWTSDMFEYGPISRYGISQDRSASLYQQTARAGGKNFDASLYMEGSLGLGDQSAGLGGSLRRSGNKGDIDDFAKIIGTAIASGMDQARFPEAMDAVKRAAESSVAVNMSMDRQLGMMEFISRGGEGYQPGSAKYDTMKAGIESLTTNKSNPIAMMEALKQSGGKWDTAQMKLALGMGTGGVDPNGTVDRYWNSSEVQAWVASVTPDSPDGDFDLLSSAAGFISREGDGGVTPLPTIAQILKDRVKGKISAPGAAATAAGKAMIMQAPPEAASSRARADAAKQQVGVLTYNKLINSAVDTSFGKNLQSPQRLLQRTQGAATAAAPAGGIGGIGDFSASDINDIAKKYDVSPALVRDAIQRESNGLLIGGGGATPGDNGTVARGYMQIDGPLSGNRFAGTEAGFLGINNQQDFQRLSYDKVYSKQKTLESFTQKLTNARDFARQHHLNNWSNDDLLHLAKYEHGGVGFRKESFDQFEKSKKRAPADWDEFYTVMSAIVKNTAGHAARDALDNADLHVHFQQAPNGHWVPRKSPASTRSSGSPGQLGAAKK